MTRPALVLALLLAAAAARADENPLVRFTTPLGSFRLELCAAASTRCLGAAPNTVANFLNYVDDDDYHGSFVHRSVPGFVIQGGSFRVDAGFLEGVPTDPPIANEFNQSNERGTVSVPLLGNGPTACDTDENSGTSGWFVNLGDNSGLDCGLFTVFAVVVEPGMQVVDAIAALPRYNLGGALGTTPLFGYPGNDAAAAPYLVYTDVRRLPEPAAPLQGLAAVAALAALRRLGARGEVGDRAPRALRSRPPSRGPRGARPPRCRARSARGPAPPRPS
jgi:cyclophilin family peptidyl-prolyl cis-trans isomerase